VYTSSGNPAKVTLPTKPGPYELKYFVGQDSSVLASAQITVTAASATLSGPTEGRAGATVDVSWTGPDDSGDYIGICKIGSNDSLHYVYTSSGNPAKVTLPTKPGSYELKYFVGEDGSTLANTPFTVK
jgi:Ca-activated chloride channel family protein